MTQTSSPVPFAPRWSTLILFALLVIVQAQLWFGSGGRPYVVSLESQRASLETVNATARARNDRLAAEVSDLREGLAMVEEKARLELGMIRANEVFVNIKPTAATAATTGNASILSKRSP